MKIEPKIDTYIASFDNDTQTQLIIMRDTIAKSAPAADEAFTYQMPTFKFHGNLVHFAAFSRHIGFYPTPSAIIAFADELLPYKCSKGAVQFSKDKPLPLQLIEKIVKYRVKENLEKSSI